MRLWDIYHEDIPDFLAEAAKLDVLVRLQGVGMNCGCEYTRFPLFRDLPPYSRFDHSMGAALIVWHFTKDPAQAMAALLHDISTPTFAHVIDFLHGDHMTQKSTESGTAKLIRSSPALMAILEEMGLCAADVEDYHRYPIADNDSPKLSADRLEYTLGNGVNFGILTREQAAQLYNDLSVGHCEDGQPELVFRSPEKALAFGQCALRCGRIYVSDEDRYAMESLAVLLRKAIAEGIIREETLMQEENAVIQALKNSPLAGNWTDFCSKSRICRHSRPSDTEFRVRVLAKKRYIDPLVEGLGRLTEKYPEFSAEVDLFLCESQDHWLSAI